MATCSLTTWKECRKIFFVIYFGLVFQLKNLLYGLKYAHHALYEKIDRFFFNLVLKCCEYDHSVYVLHVHGDNLILALYVDDIS